MVYAKSNSIIDFEPVFMRLNEELSIIGQSLELVCAGGYVMQRHGYKATSAEQPFELLSALVGMEFDVDISGLLDAYERAHGMVWLEDFYARNQEDLRKYF